MSEHACGVLYIVSTPIGNLKDITQRAIEILTTVDLIACEDTRHTQKLLTNFSINNRTISLHDHNERQRQDYVANMLKDGKNIALVSDAGTPLISDPGFHIVRHCRSLDLPVVPVPGVCAAITALSVAGVPTDKFTFEGFLPSKQGARLTTFESLSNEQRTMVFYDAPRRVIDTVTDIITAFGDSRYVVIARELTKTFETVKGAKAGELLAWLESDAHQLKGELVLIIEGAKIDPDAISPEAVATLKLLLAELPPKRACAIAAKIHDVKKNALYQVALSLKE